MLQESSSQDIEHIRHSFAHLLNIAVRTFYPKAQPAIGPAIENGFYQDFGNVSISEKDLPKIEKEMRAIANKKLAFKKELWPVSKAILHFKKEKQLYKIELAKDLAKEEKLAKLGIVRTGDILVDLCRGGHIKNTKELSLDAFKLTRVAGAYWRGDEKNSMLTRIYGVAFKTKKELEHYVWQQEEAKKRDHRKLGKELGLFAFSDLVGAGLPLFTPKGTVLRDEINTYSQELRQKRGFQKIWTPHIAKRELYITSGHWDKFGDELFLVKSQETNDQLVLKPMNCPHHQQLFAAFPRSYHELPVRFMDTTTVYRDEKKGELGGLSRVRAITQDDSHIFCTLEQIEKEYQNIIDIVTIFYTTLGLKFRARLSFRDTKEKKKYLGSDTLWNKAEKTLLTIAKRNKLEYFVAKGEAAFYGPKIDFMIMDALGREHQLATPQLDFVQPSRFKLTYKDAQGKDQTPVMIHFALAGSLERFLSVYIEHTAGVFPLWLAPEQVWIVPVSDKFVEYANMVKDQMQFKIPQLRVALRDENETLGKKIREGEMQKIPYLLVVGEKEKAKSTVGVRKRGKGDLGSMKINDFAKQLETELKTRQK